MKVLISGVAGDIGFGIARILRDWAVFSELHGIDIHDDHPASAIVDKFTVAPEAKSEEYLNWISKYVIDNDICAFIPTSESEIKTLTDKSVYKIGDVKIIRNNDFTVKKSLDKYECLSYLSSCGINVPKHGLVGKDRVESFPVIAKPRSSQGSKNILLINDSEQLAHVENGFVWQSYLEPDDEEYTCAVYSYDTRNIRLLILRRKLRGGLTCSGEVVDNPVIENYVRLIAEKMQLKGAINIQLRLTIKGPLLFEINPRISSTVVFRDKLGFSDLRWWLADELSIDPPSFKRPKVGTRFYRGSQEYIFESKN